MRTMSPTKISVYQAARLGITYCFLIQGAQGAVHDVFNVKSGSTKGGCDNQNIDQWFSDSQTLASSASAGVAATDPDSRKYLKTFFSIGPNDNADPAGGPISQVSSVLSGSVQPPGGKPWLFCSSDWLIEQKWSDVAYDENTGQPRQDGKKIQDVYPASSKEVPFWSEDLRQYLQAPSGDYCRQNNDNLAATQDMTKPSTMTLCIDNFDSQQGSMLANIPAVTAVKQSISDLQVHSLTFFHEMVHLALGTAATPDAKNGYNLNSIVRFKTPTATTNPESYAFFALAYYLGQKYPQYTFANSKSANKPPTPGPKRSISDFETDKLLSFQLVKKDMPYNAWVA
ncbi:hypothetical protein F4779DRAFT_170603 [Xylariaceae sp. FL0662B]|nr:hypothetical protein F4779DRAFT_170603 [Xylariaceae sp. FL0662B]